MAIASATASISSTFTISTIFLAVATQNATQVDILCVATAGGQALTTAVA